MADPDDDPLRDVDLSAWEAPPPPAGLVDAVMARRHAAHPVEDAPPRRARRAWLFAAVAALALGAAAFFAFGIARPPRAGHGDVVASAQEHLAFGAASSAELDPGAEVHWQRTRARLTAGQPRGAVMWTVGGSDTLQIDAGAAVASVEASGARLRVEVHMNMMDAKIIGSAALTSAAVALVTVVVYEGRAKVTSEGKTVVVEAGSTYEVRPPAPAPPPPSDPKTVGGSVPRPEARCDALALEAAPLFEHGDAPAALDRVQRAIACGGMQQRWVRDAALYACRAHDRINAHYFFEHVDATFRDSLVQACAQENIELAPAAPTPAAPGCKDAKEVIAKAEAQFSRGSPTMALATLETRIQCSTDPRVLRLAGLYACRAENQQAAEKYYDRVDNSYQVDMIFECSQHGVELGSHDRAPTSECEDLDVVLRKAETQFSAGFPTQAVNTLEIRMRCGSDVRLMRTAGLYACRGHNEALARKYYKLVDAKFQGSMLQACHQEGIALP